MSVVSVLNGNAGCRIDNEPLLTPEGVKAGCDAYYRLGPTDCMTALRPYGGTQIFGRYSHFRNIGVALMHNSKLQSKSEKGSLVTYYIIKRNFCLVAVKIGWPIVKCISVSDIRFYSSFPSKKEIHVHTFLCIYFMRLV